MVILAIVLLQLQQEQDELAPALIRTSTGGNEKDHRALSDG
jgi:hypothetical protein